MARGVDRERLASTFEEMGKHFEERTAITSEILETEARRTPKLHRDTTF